MADAAGVVATRNAAGRAALRGTARWLRPQLLRRLRLLRGRSVRITDSLGTAWVGEAAAGGAPLEVAILDSRFYRAVAAGGSVAAGEAYCKGWWTCNDLVGLVRLLVQNRDLLDGLERGPARLAAGGLRLWHALRQNSRRGSRRNIAAHYDLGNEFFRLFLSPDLMYSSAIWEGSDDSLEAASRRKLERICHKLRLCAADRVVEIGCGWGGFALHAAREHGCHVTTITVSQEQWRLASERVAQAGLTERVRVVLQDYRDLGGCYDKLVSVEMVEAVGAKFLPGYFGKIGQLLRPGGLALLQAITIEDHRYAQALRSVDFIKRHVFPGSFIPSLHALLHAKTQACDLELLHLEEFAESYARTLHAWRERFLHQLPAVRAQGFSEDFIRLWEFYLAYCEGGFRERSVSVSQLLFTKPRSFRAADRGG